MSRNHKQMPVSRPGWKDSDQVAGPSPGEEMDGGESVISGRSRERHPGVPEAAEESSEGEGQSSRHQSQPPGGR